MRLQTHYHVNNIVSSMETHKQPLPQNPPLLDLNQDRNGYHHHRRGGTYDPPFYDHNTTQI